MATKQEVVVVIAPDGSVKLEVGGIKGPSCSPIVKRIADAVGELKKEELTPEYYEKPQTQQQQKRQA